MGLSNVENILEQALAGEPITIKPESRVEALLIALIETGGGGGGGGGADTEIIADDFDATESYAVGEYVVYEGTLYKCTTAHTGAWDASDFDETQVMDEIPEPMPSADMSEVVTPLPAIPARYHRYSTTEQIVGEWIDGKPIYQKTITDDITINYSSFTDISSYVSDVEECIGAIAAGVNQFGDKFMNALGSKINNGALSVEALGSGWTFISKALTVQYTKTTD